MNKIVLILILVFLDLGSVKAQDRYVKFNEDLALNRTITCLKGEILPFKESTQSNKIDVLFNRDTIFDISLSSKMSIVKNPNTTYYLEADKLVRRKDANYLVIGDHSIIPSDTVTFVSESGKAISQLIKQREALVEKSKSGKTFRLIITNSPTIFYSLNDLKAYVDPNLDSDGDGVIDTEDNCPNTPGIPDQNGCPEAQTGFFSNFLWWHYTFLITGLILLVFGIALVIFRRRGAKRLKIKFNAGSLIEFASNYGGIKRLRELNPRLIPNDWERLDNRNKQKIIDNLQGKKLVVEAGNSEFDFHFNSSSSGNKDLSANVNELAKLTEAPTFQQDNLQMFQELGNIERRIINEIKNLSSNRGSIELIDQLKTDVNKLREENRKLDENNQAITRKLALTEQQVSESNLKLHGYSEKVLFVEFLKSYSAEVLAYLNYCNDVVNQAYYCFNNISEQHYQDAFSMSCLLVKFQNDISTIPLGNWLQIIQTIHDTGITTNKQLMRSLAQIQENEKLNEFQRLLFNEVLIRYSSSVLILIEALRNLGRFQIPMEVVKEAQETFGKHTAELVRRAKSAGLEIKYIPLFTNIEEYLAQIESVDREKTLAYKVVNKLEKGTIAEIVSYGVKTSFEETKTLIILA